MILKIIVKNDKLKTIGNNEIPHGEKFNKKLIIGVIARLNPTLNAVLSTILIVSSINNVRINAYPGKKRVHNPPNIIFNAFNSSNRLDETKIMM
jgi:hypothetical protein